MNEQGFSQMLYGMLMLDQARLAAARGGGTENTLSPETHADQQKTGVGSGAETLIDEGVQPGVGNEPDQAGDINTAKPESVAITEKEAELMQLLAAILGRSPRTAKRFVNLYRVLKAREYVASALNPLLEAESLGGMLLLAFVAGHPRGTRALLDAIDTAKPELRVSDFFKWDAQATESGEGRAVDLQDISSDPIGKVAADAAEHYLDELQMADLQRWLPTVRRFSFRSEIARVISYIQAFCAEAR
jgi:hypothetical protein